MQPVEPKHADGIPGRRVVYAEDQEEYEPLPALVEPDGTVHTLWALTDEERAALAAGGYVSLTLLTFNQPLQPILLRVEV